MKNKIPTLNAIKLIEEVRWHKRIKDKVGTLQIFDKRTWILYETDKSFALYKHSKDVEEYNDNNTKNTE